MHSQSARRGHAEEGHANNERWLLTYADLITLLLVFFVVMYSISKADDRKFAKLNASLQKAFNTTVLNGGDATSLGGEGGGNALIDDFTATRSAVLGLAQEMGVPNQVHVALRQDGMAISLSGNLLFDSGRADLNGENAKLLDRIAERLRGMPNQIIVEGHTDSIPIDSDIYPTNWELSTARATVVTRYLVEFGGISPQRLSAQGYGEFRPVADNTTREGRALNRRVDIVIAYQNSSGE